MRGRRPGAVAGLVLADAEAAVLPVVFLWLRFLVPSWSEAVEERRQQLAMHMFNEMVEQKNREINRSFHATTSICTVKSDTTIIIEYII